MNNPFVTKGYAGADYFCDRVKETEDLVKMFMPPTRWLIL